MSITAFLCSPNMFLYAFILYVHLNINVKSRWGTVPSQNNGEEKQNSTDIKHKKGGEDQERMHDSKKENSFPKSGPWNTISRFFIYFLESRTPSASAETRTDDTQQTENIRAGVVFVLQMYACPFWEKTESKTVAYFFLKTLPSGTQRRMRYKSFHALSATCLERLKTAKRCWGHTAVAAQWRDHFWHLLWTLPKTACLEWEDRNGGENKKRHCKTWPDSFLVCSSQGIVLI